MDAVPAGSSDLAPSDTLNDVLHARYLALRAEVDHHNRAYHEQDEPEIPGQRIRRAGRELRALEAAHPQWAARPRRGGNQSGAGGGRRTQQRFSARESPHPHDQSGQRIRRRRTG